MKGYRFFFLFSVWPQYVRQRIKDTYMYFGGSLAFTAASAVAVSRNPMLMRLMSKNSLMVNELVFKSEAHPDNGIAIKNPDTGVATI